MHHGGRSRPAELNRTDSNDNCEQITSISQDFMQSKRDDEVSNERIKNERRNEMHKTKDSRWQSTNGASSRWKGANGVPNSASISSNSSLGSNDLVITNPEANRSLHSSSGSSDIGLSLDVGINDGCPESEYSSSTDTHPKPCQILVASELMGDDKVDDLVEACKRSKCIFLF